VNEDEAKISQQMKENSDETKYLKRYIKTMNM
jgi:hypothetical protein